jgi:hypothetical protein
MSGVPLETCWAFSKLWNNKFYYKAASCWYFYWGDYWNLQPPALSSIPQPTVTILSYPGSVCPHCNLNLHRPQIAVYGAAWSSSSFEISSFSRIMRLFRIPRFKFINKSFQQMQLILSLFRLFPFTLHVSGPYWPIIRGACSCYCTTIWFLQCCWLFVRPWTWPCTDKATSTDARTVNNTARTKW